MRAKRTDRPIVVVTRRYGGEFSATTTRLEAYTRALESAGTRVVVVPRFPFVYEGRGEDGGYRGRLSLGEEIAGVTVVRARIPAEATLIRWLDRVLRLHARLRRKEVPSLIGLEVIELLYGLVALPLVAALRPRA